ncbi:hypothetical protein ACJX0J_008425, partial [Zea mays]
MPIMLDLLERPDIGLGKKMEEKEIEGYKVRTQFFECQKEREFIFSPFLNFVY